jgi:hypothetical protein
LYYITKENERQHKKKKKLTKILAYISMLSDDFFIKLMSNYGTISRLEETS